IYVYAQTGTVPNCTDENSFIVTITPNTNNVTTASACGGYHWAVNNTDYTSSGTYTYVTGCHTETLNLTIDTATTPTGATTQVINGGVASDATIEDIVVSGTGIIWYPTALDAANNTNAIPAGTQLVDGEDYFAVSVNGTCTSSALQVTVTVVLGHASFDLSQLNYYPNPVKDIFNVKYSKEITSVDVYDLTGRKVIEMKPNTLEVQLNMTSLSNAMYIVRLQSVDGITELKVYKN
ncbi:T9SS type A sorting domain-containing protein, partial [Flavobacterium terrigena]